MVEFGSANQQTDIGAAIPHENPASDVLAALGGRGVSRVYQIFGNTLTFELKWEVLTSDNTN